jgi:hypothetical protein
MGEKTTKYPFVSEGEMMFGKKFRVKSKDLLGFKNFFTRKGDKYDTSLEADIFKPYIGLKFTRKKKNRPE